MACTDPAPASPPDAGPSPASLDAGEPPEPPPSASVAIRRGAVGNIAPDCSIGVVALGRMDAMLSWAPAGAKENLYGAVNATVPVGGAIPACGRFYRLAEAGPEAAVVQGPAPLPPGIMLGSDGVAVPVRGDVDLRTGGRPAFTLRVRVRSVEGAGADRQANLDLTEVEFRVPGDPPTGMTSRTAQVKSGDAVTAGTYRFRVLGIVAPDPGGGIPGWVEFDPRPGS